MDTVDELLTRGVENIIPSKEALKGLLGSGKKLNIYLGIDPTATQIHLGNAVMLRKLNTFATMGHNVSFLIGDFTALIGDTSDKDKERPSLSYETIKANFENYKAQAQKVLDFSKISVVYNSSWLSKLTFTDIVSLCQHFSVGDFVSRELIRRRMEAKTRVALHEVLYPVMQGYDSYHLDCDIQLGGTDQTFNMAAGRTLQKELRGKESFVMAGSFLSGTDGRKMSKTWGNAIWLTDTPVDMFGKVMSVRDDLIVEYFTLATNVSGATIDLVKARLAKGDNPMILKKELGQIIVTQMYDAQAAAAAQSAFESTFSQKALPTDIEELTLAPSAQSSLPTLTVLTQTGLVKSTSEAKRLVKSGAVEVDGKVVSPEDIHDYSTHRILKIGKKKFAKVKIQQ